MSRTRQAGSLLCSQRLVASKGGEPSGLLHSRIEIYPGRVAISCLVAISLLLAPSRAWSSPSSSELAYTVGVERSADSFRLSVSLAWCPAPDVVPAFRVPVDAQEIAIRDDAGNVLPISIQPERYRTGIWTNPLREGCLRLTYTVDRPIRQASDRLFTRDAMTGDIPATEAGFYLSAARLLPMPLLPRSTPYELRLEAGSGIELVSTVQAEGALGAIGTAALAAVVYGTNGHVAPVGQAARIVFLNTDSMRQRALTAQIEELENYLKRTLGLDAGLFTLIVSGLPEHATGPWLSGKGHGATGAMIAYSEQGEPLGLTWGAAHELWHRVIPSALVPNLPDTEYRTQAWLVEGMTDYLAIKSLTLTGGISPAQAAAIWSRLAREHASSPVRGQTAEQIAAGFWTDPAAQRWPYLNGAMIAAVVDQRIIAASSGALQIEDVIAFMARSPDRSSHQLGGRLQAAVMAVAGVDVSDLVAQATQGPPMDVPASLPHLCLASIERTVPVFELGFDIFSLLEGDGTLKSVTGPAREAGLRPGLRLVRNITVNRWDATAPVAWVVDTGVGEATVSWLPAGDRMVTARVFQPIPDCDPGRYQAD